MSKHKQTYRKARPDFEDRRDKDLFTCCKCGSTSTTAELLEDCQGQLMITSELMTYCLTKGVCPWCALDVALYF